MMRITLLLLLTFTLCLTAKAQQREHTVARGESLAMIAEKYGVTEAQLKAANPNMKMFYTGATLVIPSPDASVEAMNRENEANADQKIEINEEGDTVKASKVKFKKFFKSVGKGIGKAAKVSGAVAKAVVVTKLKGGSYYDAINKGIEAADSTLHGKESAYGLLDQGSKEVTADDILALTGSSEDAPSQEELTEVMKGYQTKYQQFDGELGKLRATFEKANNVVKSRTWKNVSESAATYREQMTKIREECEMYTGLTIPPSDNEQWKPIVPRK